MCHRSLLFIIVFLSFHWGGGAFACPIHHKRLVSLAPDLTEILYALGLENQIVAVSDYSDFPKEAQKKPRIGSFISPNLEKILSFKPDIVFARDGATPPQLIAALKQNKVEILSFPANHEDDIYQILETVGKKFKREKRGAELVQSMKSEIESIKRRPKIKRKKNKPKVLVELEAFPMIVAGRNTLLDRAIELAGGINAAHSYTDYPKLQLEAVYPLKPEIIIIPITQKEKKRGGEMETYWKGMKNLRGIYEIDADLISRASPRFARGVKRLAQIFDSAGQ